MNYKYLVLKGKKPKTNFNDTKTYDEVKDEPEVGIKMEAPAVVYDFDDLKEFNIAQNILKAYDIKTKMMKTTKGGHIWFKSDVPLKNVVDHPTPLGLATDIRSWGKKSLVCIKKDGAWREWINEDAELAEIPFFFKLLKYKTHKPFVGMTEGDGRNSALFEWIIPLLNEGFTKEQVFDIIALVNEFVFDEPLSEEEIDNMTVNNPIYEDYEVGLAYQDPDKHNVFGSALAEEYNLKAYYQQVYIYEHGTYTNDPAYIERLMISKNDTIKNFQRVEIMKYLKLLEPAKNNLDEAKNYINCKNGLLNIETFELEPHTSDIFDMNQINVHFDPAVETEFSEDLFDQWSNGDPKMRMLMEEVMGYAFVKDLEMQKSALILGWGGNGKSTYLELMHAMAGGSNVTTVSLEDLDGDYKAAEMAGKLINIGGDISGGRLSESAVFKKLSVGDPFITRRIYGEPFELKSYAFQIFGANTFPSVSDKTDGFFRRWVILAFDRTFGSSQSLSDKLTFKRQLMSPENLTACFNIAMRGLIRLKEQGGFTEPELSAKLLAKFRHDNNNVLAWLQEIPQSKYILNCNIVDSYKVYCEAIRDKNQKPCNINNFRDYVEKFAKFKVKAVLVEGQGTFFKRVEEIENE